MASMFHLFTHAFFKALLFLCAGAVIHAVHSNDMNSMGGLRKLMPITHITFLIACLAIAGIPPFAGFFSKEEIMTAAYHSNMIIYVVALITAAFTAFYMFRLYYSLFWNKRNLLNSEQHHGEGTLSMKIPLIILGAGALLAGFVPFSKLITSDGMPLHTELNLGFSATPVLLAVLGILLARRMYLKENDLPQKVSVAISGLYRVSYRKFYIDEIYLFVTKKIIFNLIGRPAAWFDRNIVDGFMNLLASVTSGISTLIKGVQSGKVQNYALLLLLQEPSVLSLLFIYLSICRKRKRRKEEKKNRGIRMNLSLLILCTNLDCCFNPLLQRIETSACRRFNRSSCTDDPRRHFISCILDRACYRHNCANAFPIRMYMVCTITHRILRRC